MEETFSNNLKIRVFQQSEFPNLVQIEVNGNLVGWFYKNGEMALATGSRIVTR